MANTRATNIYASCLSEMAKTFRAAHFYPAEHPAMSRSISRSHMYLRNLLRVESPLIFTLTKNQVLHRGEPVPVQLHVIKDLAFAIFRRRIKVLHIESGLLENEIQSFFQLLQTDAAQLEALGGPEKALAQFGIVHLWCNEVRFSQSDAEEGESEDLGEETGEGTVAGDDAVNPLEALLQVAASEETRSVLQELAEESDPAVFKSQLGELVTRTKVEIENASPNAAVPVVTTLAHIIEFRPAPFSTMARKAMQVLVTPAVLTLLIEHMYRAIGTLWQAYQKIFLLVGEATIPYLLRALLESSDRKERMRTIACVSQFGLRAMPMLGKLLQDERWFVVRNAIFMLESMPQLPKAKQVEFLLQHPHEKVRREAATLLRKIGDEEAFRILKKSLDYCEQTDQRFLLAEISSFPTEYCEPLLLKYLKRGPLFVRVEAANGLAVLGSATALKALATEFIRKGSVLRRDKDLMFRKAVGERLLSLLPDAYPAFQRVRDEHTPVLQRLVREADVIMKKRAWS